ncbi:MAG TPA: DUF3592 domain-containing protein [Actinocrinis sp.]|nr:DUF3592 domain-containing protein [Actinocrinis sp.]
MVIGILEALFGGVCVWLCVNYLDKKLIPALHARRHGVEVEGRVVGVKTIHHRYSTSRIPEVTFTTLDGETIRFAEGIGTGPYRLPGESVIVRYDPNEPAHSATTADGEDVVRKTVAISFITVLFCLMMTIGLLSIVGVLKPQ